MANSYPISASIGEYLENIYRLEEEHGVARTSKLAERVGVSLGTVTNTIDVLEKKNLIVHKPYHGVKLTKTGRQLALDVIRHHRLSERLLTEILNMKWSHVHDYACELEHALPKEVIQSLNHVLGYPTTCPHGNPVPTPNGTLSTEHSQPLDSLEPGQAGTILKISRERRDYLEYIEKLQLLPGIHVQMQTKAPFDGPITITVGGTIRTLGRNIAAIIHVQPEG